jgi:hypothetical protein
MKLHFPLLLLLSSFSFGQTLYTAVPKKNNTTSHYLFYLHGRIVEEQGTRAVSPEFGPYEYMAILDTLANHDFIVISEARPVNTEVEFYAEKVSKQIDTLLKAGVKPEHIFVVGASKGAFITLYISVRTKNDKINYALIGTCNKEDVNYWLNEKSEFCGNFLTIYETSDAYGGPCQKLLSKDKCISGFQEVKLTMNNKHAFLYKPYSEWVNPLITWANKIRQ